MHSGGTVARKLSPFRRIPVPIPSSPRVECAQTVAIALRRSSSLRGLGEREQQEQQQREQTQLGRVEFEQQFFGEFLGAWQRLYPDAHPPGGVSGRLERADTTTEPL
jgi:hypothetical protein